MVKSKIIGKKILHYQEIDSTNDEAKRLARKGVPEGTVIIAETQTKGRGKPGNWWFSPSGVGLYLSAIVKPFKNPKDLSSITLIGAKAMVETISKVSRLEGKVKLPNDVVINGKKVGGVLVERITSGHLVMGIGVNINNEPGAFPEEIKDTATSLCIESGKDYDVEEFIRILISKLDKEYLAYLKGI